MPGFYVVLSMCIDFYVKNIPEMLISLKMKQISRILFIYITISFNERSPTFIFSIIQDNFFEKPV